MIDDGGQSIATDRVMVFIDGSNLYHSLRDFCNRTDLDYQRFAGVVPGPGEK